MTGKVQKLPEKVLQGLLLKTKDELLRAGPGKTAHHTYISPSVFNLGLQDSI